MRILLTGVTGLLGRALARQFVATGHAVTGIATDSHENLHPDVDFVRAALGDPVLQPLADSADVVVHLAPIDPSAPGNAGLDGLVRVAHATARAGARLIYLSAAAGEPVLREQAETLVGSGWAPSLVVRVAPLVGRQLDWMICRTVGGLMRGTSAAAPLRVLHFEDLVRFLTLAVATNRTGVVDLAHPDAIDVAAARGMVRSAGQRFRLARLRGWPVLRPDLDITNVSEEWQFEFGWHPSDAVADTRRGLDGRKVVVDGTADLPGHVALPVEVAPPVEPWDRAPLRSALPEEQEGEFDDRVDPRFPVFSASPLAETLPGPLSPMTLDVQIAGLRAAARMISPVMACGDFIAAEWDSRAVAVFGHRPYVGASASVIAANRLPGWDVDEVTREALGEESIDLFPRGRPPQGGRLGSAAAKAVTIKRAVTLLRHLKSDTECYLAAAAAEHLSAAQLNSLPDARLQSRVRLLRDRIHQGWALTGLWLVDSGVTAATVERLGVQTSVAGLGALLESGAIADETSRLAVLIRDDLTLCARAIDGDLDAFGAQSQPIGAAFAAAVGRIGHRGPGEVELANLMIDDDPTILLTAAGRAATELPQRLPPAEAEPTLPERLAASARASRESAYDTTIRFTHELRMTLRELGSRLVDEELIDVAGEIFYLTCDEAVTVPSDARLRIKRRRAERERFQGWRLSDVITVS